MMMARTDGDEFLMFPVWISNYEETNKVTINNVFLHREQLYKLYPYSFHKTLGRSYLNLVTENAPKRKHTHVMRLCFFPLKLNQSWTRDSADVFVECAQDVNDQAQVGEGLRSSWSLLLDHCLWRNCDSYGGFPPTIEPAGLRGIIPSWWSQRWPWLN